MENNLIEKQDSGRKRSVSLGTGPFSPSRPRIGSFLYVLPGWLVDPCPPGGAHPKTLNLYRKF